MQDVTSYNSEDLFDIKKDSIVYKNSNSVYNITYNTNSQAGLLKTDGIVPYITVPSLAELPMIKHGFSTRLGGVSQGDFNSMNLSFVRGDHIEAVTENYNRMLEAMDVSNTHIIFSDQVHDTVVHKVTKEDYPSSNPYEKRLAGIDGLITNENHVTLVTSYADCVPLYFVDPVNKAIGLSHSGWKGTVGKIGKKTVEAMTKEYGTNPEDVIAVIGPSICFDCYEISADVANQFKEHMTKEQCSSILYEKGNDKYHLDLWLANKYILLDAGIREENITNSNICTCCNSSLFFSHRASRGKRGNLAAFLTLSY